MKDVLAVILGGGRGSRLFPLTLHRSKPAVPIGGKYRLIDIPISNCLNSDLRRIFVLTQYNSESLNKHLYQTYKFDLFSSGFVSLLAAEQTEESPEWFQGTADAVRQSLRHLDNHRYREVLILSGDQLYQMDYRRLLETHRRQMADVTVAVTPGDGRADLRLRHPQGQPPGAHRPLRGEARGRAAARPRLRAARPWPRPTWPPWASTSSPARCWTQVLRRAGAGRLRPARHPPRWCRASACTPTPTAATGRTWGPSAPTSTPTWPSASRCRPSTSTTPSRPVFTHPRFLPATKVEQCSLRSVLLSEGSILVGAEVERAVVGIRSRIGRGARVLRQPGAGRRLLRDAGGDRARAGTRACRPSASATDSRGRSAPSSTRTRASGAACASSTRAATPSATATATIIRDGIVIVPKNGVIPDGTVI